MSRAVHVIDHPLVQHKLTLMRRKDTSTKSFRELAHEVSILLAYELTREMPMQEIEIETPLEKMTSRIIEAVEYYFKMPQDMAERDVIVLDPMLATGNSAVAAVDRLKQTQPRSLRFVCLVACPEGIKNFHDHHPDVPIYTPAVDRGLNEHGYIVPGLGDAGDRIFGTK